MGTETILTFLKPPTVAPTPYSETPTCERLIITACFFVFCRVSSPDDGELNPAQGQQRVATYHGRDSSSYKVFPILISACRKILSFDT